MIRPVETRQIRHNRKHPRLSDEAATHVRELIISGNLKPGEFIRPEAIADELGVSTTPAREGLLTLQSEGFLHVEPRRGFIVSPLSSDDVSDTFVAQALLAGELAARAAVNITARDVKVLTQIQERLEAAAKRDDLDEVEQQNYEFHRLIYRIADAPKILWLLRASLRYAPRRFYPTIGGWPQATIHDHHAILEALRKSDADAAREATNSHIRNAGRLLAEHLSAQR